MLLQRRKLSSDVLPGWPASEGRRHGAAFEMPGVDLQTLVQAVV
jgi:hypothetical protein